MQIIQEQMNVPAFNAISDGAALGDCVIQSLKLGNKLRAAAGSAG